VLQDGLPLMGAQVDAFGLLQAPPLDLARVELIKGVASALYGASALGGVLNLVSRVPGSESELLLNRTSRSATDIVGFLSGRSAQPWGFTLTGGAHDQAREDIDHDGWADLADTRSYTLRPRLYWSDGSSSLLATAGWVDEDRRGGSEDFREALHT